MIAMFKDRKKLLVFWALTVVLLLLGSVVGRLATLLAMLAFCVACMMLPSEQLYALLFGLLPFASVFKLSAYTLSMFTVAQVLVLVVIFTRVKKSNKGFFFVMIALAAYMFLVTGESFRFLTVAKIIIGLGLFYGFCQVVRRREVVSIGILFSCSTLIMMLLSSYEPYFSRVKIFIYKSGDYDVVIDQNSQLFRSGGFLGDANFCSLMIILCLCLLCVLYFYQEIGFEFWVFFAALGSLGMLTYSKSYVLCFAMLCIFVWRFVLYPKSKWLAWLFAGGIVLLGFAALSGNFAAIGVIIRRFQTGDLTTGRMELMSQYLTYIFSDVRQLLLGASVSANAIEGINHIVHNLYVQMLYCLGVVGSMLYIGAWLSCLKKQGSIYNVAERKAVNYIPLAFFAVMSFFLPEFLDYAMPFYIMIVYASFYFHLLRADEASDEKSPSLAE